MCQVNRCIPVILYQGCSIKRQCGGLVSVGRLKIWFQVVEFVPDTESTSQNRCAQLFFQRDPGRLWRRMHFFYSKSVDYLLVVDYFSRYVEVAALRKTRQRQRLSGHLKLFLQEMESLRRSALTTDPHMIFKNTAILQENGVFRLHQVTPGMSSQMVR